MEAMLIHVSKGEPGSKHPEPLRKLLDWVDTIVNLLLLQTQTTQTGKVVSWNENANKKSMVFQGKKFENNKLQNGAVIARSYCSKIYTKGKATHRASFGVYIVD